MNTTIPEDFLLRVKTIVDLDNKLNEDEWLSVACHGLHIRLKSDNNVTLCKEVFNKERIRVRVSFSPNIFKDSPVMRDLLSEGAFCKKCQDLLIKEVVNVHKKKELADLRKSPSLLTPNEVKVPRLPKIKHVDAPKAPLTAKEIFDRDAKLIDEEMKQGHQDAGADRRRLEFLKKDKRTNLNDRASANAFRADKQSDDDHRASCRHRIGKSPSNVVTVKDGEAKYKTIAEAMGTEDGSGQSMMNKIAAAFKH